MKKSKMLKVFKIKASLFLFLCFFAWVAFAVWNDVVSHTFSSQSSSWVGSNSSIISFITSPSSASTDYAGYYINKWNNSTIIGNYFEWYYYDSMFWLFKLDWSSDLTQNVRIIWSTTQCPDSYWYKIGWYAYSEDFGFIDFDYSSAIYVYYCEWDQKLYWYTYNDAIGFQNFDWIGFDVVPNVDTSPVLTSSGIFVNDSTTIEQIQIYTWSTSNVDYNAIWWDLNEFDTTKESIFYIIK